MMRISEILCIPVYISCILASIEHLCLITIRNMTLDASTNLYLQGKIVEDAGTNPIQHVFVFIQECFSGAAPEL